MKNYYATLGLTNFASIGEVKRAYRYLALQFHPDKNKSAEAVSFFIEINAAYEVIGDPLQKVVYDQMLARVDTPPEAVPQIKKPHRDPRYQPKSEEYIKQARTRKQPYLAFMNSYVKLAVLFSRLAFIFSIVLVADYSLPATKHSQRIKAVEKKLGNESVKVEINDGEAFTLGGSSLQEFSSGEVISLYLSPLFSIPTKIESDQTNFQAQVPITIYGNFIFAPFFLLITSLVGMFYWKSVEFRFNLGVINFLLVILNAVFLNIHAF